jgi:RHS repeat-associated protein
MARALPEKVEMKHQVNSSWVSYRNLDSVRVLMAADGTAEQANHYYAFGGLMGDSGGGDVQKYKYNGKELDRFLSWDMLDYGARWMDGKLQQWPTVDPQAEKDPGVSPYVYCHNDPINRIDPDGRYDFFNEKGEFMYRTEVGDFVLMKFGGGFKCITDIDFSNNTIAIQNIGRHYLAMSDDAEFNLTIASSGSGIPQGAVFSNNAGTPNYELYLTDGHVNSVLGNRYNFECVTFHETTHRYDSSTYGGPIGEINAIMRTIKECPAWNNASIEYIQSQALYAEKSLNDYLGNKIGYIEKLNNSFAGFAIFSLENNRVSLTHMLEGVEVWGRYH